jgi:hypothetical protein
MRNFYCHTRSTIGKERKPRSRCHCKYAAIKPLASRRNFASLALAVSQSLLNSAPISSKVSGAGVAHAEGLQSAHTDPPPTNEKYLWGPGFSHREQIVIDGAYPATARDLNKNASKIRSGS